MRLNHEELTDLVNRTERAARRGGWTGNAMARLDIRSDGSRRLSYNFIAFDPIATALKRYHERGGTFPVYIIPIGVGYELAGDVTEIRAYPLQRPLRHADRGPPDLLVTHPLG